ncbi:MAG: hypothetical protein ACKOFO_10290, partial [Gemmatimonadota bacterium]
MSARRRPDLPPAAAPCSAPRRWGRRVPVGAAIVAIGAASGLLSAQARPAPPSTGEPWRILRPPQASLVLARDGSLIGRIGREW